MTSGHGEMLDHIVLTLDIVSSFIGRNSLPPGELPGLITSVHATLIQLSAPEAFRKIEQPVPAVSVRKSVTQDYIVCLEDGKRFKSLKRHLRSKYNLTPDEYRARWKLPVDYPMVAPSYAAERSQLAKTMGLGQMRRAAAAR